MPGKKLNEKFANVIYAKNQLFKKSQKFFFKYEKPKIRRKHKEKCRNSLVLDFQERSKKLISNMLR